MGAAYLGQLLKTDQTGLRNQNGLSLKLLVIIIAGICVLVAIIVPMFTNIAQRAPHTRAKWDTEAIACGINRYAAHMGSLPAALSDLTVEITNSPGDTAVPLWKPIPSPPPGWTGYTYSAKTDGTYTMTSTGDGYTVTGTQTKVTVVRRDGTVEDEVLPLRC